MRGPLGGIFQNVSTTVFSNHVSDISPTSRVLVPLDLHRSQLRNMSPRKCPVHHRQSALDGKLLSFFETFCQLLMHVSSTGRYRLFRSAYQAAHRIDALGHGSVDRWRAEHRQGTGVRAAILVDRECDSEVGPGGNHCGRSYGYGEFLEDLDTCT